MGEGSVARNAGLLIVVGAVVALGWGLGPISPTEADVPEEQSPFDDGAGEAPPASPPGQKPGPGAPYPEPRLTLSLEPYAPFTTVRHVAPQSLTLPKHTKATFTVTSNAPVADFVWTGAEEVGQEPYSSTAKVDLTRAGSYTVVVIPVVRLPGGRLQPQPGQSKSVAITATNANSRKVSVRITDSRSTPLVGHVGQVFQLQAKTSPPGYEGLIEWTGGGSPSSGLGPEFTTYYFRNGRFTLRAGASSTQAIDVYAISSIVRESASGQTVWYGYPITFAATTNPPGFESHIPWRVESMHDMMTRADPASGKGPHFTTTFQPSTDGRSFWAQVYAAEVAAFTTPDQLPAIGSNPPGGNDGLESPNEACRTLGTDLTRRPRTKNAGDVYLHSGEYFLEQVDLRIKGRGFDFVWKRKYRSREGRHTTMGWNWDFAYNIRLQTSADDPADRWVYDGETSRRDTYKPSAGGCWAAEGLFNELCQEVDGTYVLTLPNGTQWRLAALDGSATAGAIQSITDRNLNTMTFDYDGAGRLATINDTFDRPIQVTYTADGHIAAVSDFTGRQVRYAYYQTTSTDGSAGDLKSWTSPVIVGTPNGNDFPAGKTTTYKYSRNTGHVRLDHNLLTITDPLGQEFLRNVYTSITDPAMRGFDRLSHQFLPDGTIFYYYVPEVPAPGNGMATTRTIVLDRARNVREASFNAHNQMVVLREFTGRAPSSNGPTTDTTNRPTGKLRAQDPDFYETRGICDVDSLRTSVQYPCDDQMTASYMKHVNPAANRREQGNLLQFTTFPGPRGGDQSSITEQFQHLSGFGSCCGDIFVTQHVDGRTNQTTHSYDSRGNRLQTLHPVSGVVEDYEYDGYGQMTAYIHPDNGTGWRSRDEFVYDSNPNLRVASASGDPYLLERRVDVLGQSLVTTFEHDAVGNVTRTINPLNQDTLHTFNALDQVVRVSSRKVSPASAVRYLRDTFYNANDQVFRVDVQNLDADGVLQPNAAFSTTHTFDTLGRIIAIKKEVDPTHDIQKIFAYDANGNQREIRDGESAALRQVANMVRVSYDERDLTFRETEAPDSPDASTTQYDYDCGGNVTRATLGLEAVPHVYQYTYDGYDRMTVAQAPLGNVQDFHYDPNDNLQSMQFQGEVLDTPGGGANILIADVGFVYDAMNRPTRRELEHFDLETLADIGDGKSTTVYEYNAASQLFKVTDDNGRIMQAQFDSALRLSEWTDAKGNRVTYSYDDGMNLTSVVQTEIAGLGGPDQQFSTTYEYDGLGRVTRRADSSGNTTDMAYDSRNNLTLLTDALRVPSPGGAGNKTTSTYDGLNRQLSSTLTLTSNGQGNGVPSGNITVTQDWDDSGRLTEECDGVGHCTQYTYDPKNQVIRIDHADGTFETREYDIHGHVTRVVDANGTVIDSTYDDLDGLTHRTITPGTGVSNATTFVDYKYDGLSRVVRAETDQALVTRKYDSLSNVVQETINGLTVQSLFDGEGNSIQDTYPDGTILFTTFDELNRKSTISNQAGLIAEYFYDGPGRVRRRNYGNGTRTDYTYDGLDGVPNPPGDFGVQQLTRLTASSIATGVPFDDRSFKWDRVGSRVQRENLLAATPGLPRSHQYEYDSAYRLKRTTILDPTSTTLSVTDYGLDATGNRVTVTGPGGGAYTSSSTLPSPGDAQMNQYTSTPFDTRAYDGNGNMVATLATGMPQPRVLSYDYDNQLVQVIDPNSGLDVRFAYDAFGRRVSKYVGGAGTPSFRYAYREGQEIAETNGAGATLATFVYGNKVDELLMMRRGGANHFYQADDQNTVVSLTNAAGAVLERYDYDDFGKPAALSTFGNPYLFGGRRYDADIGLYYYRARYLDPSVGRFVTRDPLGAWGDAMNAGNAFTYVGNNPWSRTDPTGMLGAINYVGCEGKENSVYLDLMRSETLARGAYSHLAGGSRILHACDMRYMTWFGFYKKSRYETVTSGFAAIKGFVSDENLTINCTSAGSDCLSANAYVDYDVPDTVYLCSNYFHFNSNLGIKALGLFGGSYDDRTARGAILLHEFSHLKANTEDLGKMPWTCQGLARTDPSRAIRNANNYLYFAISPIEGYCSLSQLLATTVLNSARELVGSAGRLALRAEKKAAKFLERAADKVSSAAKRWKKKWKWH